MSWANDYVGIPWRWRGRSKRTGVDCYGIVRLVYQDKLKIVLPEEQYLATGDAAMRIKRRRTSWISADEVQPFDVAIVRTIARHPITQGVAIGPHHLSICVDEDTVLEAKEPIGVITGPWPKRIVEWVRPDCWH